MSEVPLYSLDRRYSTFLRVQIPDPYYGGQGQQGVSSGQVLSPPSCRVLECSQCTLQPPRCLTLTAGIAVCFIRWNAGFTVLDGFGMLTRHPANLLLLLYYSQA